MACLNLVLATAVFQTEYIIHDAILAVGHKPDETDGFLASHADEVCALLAVHGSTPEDAKARLDARKKKTVKTEPVADGGLQAAEPDSENSDW